MKNKQCDLNTIMILFLIIFLIVIQIKTKNRCDCIKIHKEYRLLSSDSSILRFTIYETKELDSLLKEQIKKKK